MEALKKEIKDLLICLKWSELAAATVFENEIDNKSLLPFLTKANITKLCSITCKLGGGADGNKVSMIAEDQVKLMVYWVRHRICISQPWDLTTIDPAVLGIMSQQYDLEGQIPEVPRSLVIINVNDWPKAFELICEHLDQHCRLTGNWLFCTVCVLS